MKVTVTARPSAHPRTTNLIERHGPVFESTFDFPKQAPVQGFRMGWHLTSEDGWSGWVLDVDVDVRRVDSRAS